MENLNNNPEDRFVVSDEKIKWGINGQQKSPEEINGDLIEKRKKLQEKSLEKYIIIGSVVGIEGNYNKLMIIGYKVKNNNGEIKDYIACKYPDGATNPLVSFNHEDIKRVYFVGFTTQYGNEYKSNLDEEDKKKGMRI